MFSFIPIRRNSFFQEANRMAINSGLNICISGVKDPSYNNLCVVWQSIEVGSKVARGTVIEIKILRTDFED